jgi:hypothetical protein
LTVDQGFELNSNFKPSQTTLNLDQPIGGLSKLKKIVNKIWICRKLIRNNFPYWDFFKFGIEFELNSIEI